MGSQRWLLFISHIIIHLVGLTIAQPDPLYHFCIDSSGNYTSNSTYRSNLDTALSSISSNTTTISTGFYNFSVGQNSDTANAIALCRGDVEPDICRSCVNNSTLTLRELCPNQKEAILWYDFCMLRYSNRSIFQTPENSPTFYMWSPINTSSVDQFNQVLRSLLDTLRSQAAGGDSVRKFATGDIPGPDFLTIYGLMQCTPDLTRQQCDACLARAATNIPQCCDGRRGGRVVGPSCNLRYEDYLFYTETPTAAPAPSQSPPPPPPSPPLQERNLYIYHGIHFV